jgi:hypothetical protein
MIDVARDVMHALRHAPGAVRVTLAGRTAPGLMEVQDELLLADGGAGVYGAQTSVTIATGSLPGLRIGAAVSVRLRRGTVSGTVREMARIDDGALTRVYLGAVS